MINAKSFYKRAASAVAAITILLSSFYGMREVSTAESSDSATQILINSDFFPDPLFRNYVLKNIDKNKNKILDEEEIINTTRIDVHLQSNTYTGPANLVGIEYFTSLNKLICGNNTSITKLDVSKNTELTYLDCSYCRLTKLDVSNNTHLSYLDCCGNGSLQSLIVGNNTELQHLNCHSNWMSQLDISGCPSLSFLNCGNNNLETINTSNNKKLSELRVYDNRLKSIDISQNTQLECLMAHGNAITAIDISNQPNLQNAYYNDVIDTSMGYCSHNYRLTYPKNTKITYASIVRISGATRFETSIAVAEQYRGSNGKLGLVLVASGTSFADALTGSYLSAIGGAPILLTANKPDVLNKTVTYIKNNLISGGDIVILGGEGAVPASFESFFEGDGFRISRIAGANRYETNLNIFREVGFRNSSEVLVCTGADFADSLSASATGKPILLVPGKLTDSQKEFLDEYGRYKKYIIIGGTGAVSESVEQELSEYGEIERLSGANRFETSVMIANRFFNNPTNIVLAYSQTAWDGLSAGPLAIKFHSPLILTLNSAKWTPVAASYVADNKIGVYKGYVIGGASLINDKTAKTICRIE